MSLAELVSSYVGLVTEVDELLPSPDDARHFHAVAAAASTKPTLGAPGAAGASSGGGYSAVRAAARDAAIGETVERYSAAFVPERSLLETTARELGAAAPVPETFALFAPEQHAEPGFPFVPFTSDTPVRWVRARRLGDGGEAWLPAQLVYLRTWDDEPLVAYATSNGLAAGADADTALLAALLELVERDAFMLAWNARLSFPLLDWTASRALRAYHERYLAPARARLSAVDLSAVHGIPVVLALVRGNLGALGIGAAAAPTVEEAWRKAVAEAYAVRTAARELVLREPEPPFADDFRDVLDFSHHIQVYAYDENAHRAAFLDASAARRDPGSVEPLPAATARAVVDRLARNGIESFAVDVTSPDVREAGLAVVRAVAPRLLPLDVRHDARFLGGDRLRARCAFADLNPDPHPFP